VHKPHFYDGFWSSGQKILDRDLLAHDSGAAYTWGRLIHGTKRSSVKGFLPLTHHRPAMPFGNKKNILEDLFSSVLSQFKKYHPPGSLKFNYLVIFQSLKLRVFMEKLLLIPLKLNLTPNTLGCYGFNRSLQMIKISANSKRRFPKKVKMVMVVKPPKPSLV